MYFRQLNVQKWSERSVFFTFRLRNMLRASMACTFSTSQLPRVVQKRGVFLHAFTILTLTCASRHNSVHFFDISTSENGVFCTFCLQHVLVPQRRALFDISTSKVLWTWGVLCILFSKCASFWSLIRPDGSAPAALASLLFDPPETGEKHNVSRLFHLFAHLNPLSADSLSSDPFSSRTALATVAASVHKSEIWLLNFPR